MTRSFSSRPVDESVIQKCTDLAVSAPSAGKSQGWNVLLLEGEHTARYWEITMPVDQRESFVFPGLLQAPCIALMLADRKAYLDRYSEPDKARSGLGESVDAWVAPYWTIDASFSTMIFLLALEDAGLGALFFAHNNEESLRKEFNIPEEVEILGTVAFGHHGTKAPRGRSSSRTRRSVDEVIHRATW